MSDIEDIMHVLLPTSKSFDEQLVTMPFLERCIVLGIVMGESSQTIKKTLRLTTPRYNKIVEEKRLIQWKIFDALLDK